MSAGSPERFIVTEIEGFLHRAYAEALATHVGEGLSCHVIDTHWNDRLLATYRSEDIPVRRPDATYRKRIDKQAHTRHLAHELADRLNREEAARHA